MIRYLSVRPYIKTGDVLAFRGRTFIGRFIRAVTGGSWSHVGVAYWLGERLMIVQEREFAGMQIVPLSQNLPCDWIKTGITLTPAAEAEMLDRLGDKYSYLDAVRIGIGLSPKYNDRICSTVATTVLNKCGKAYPTGQSPNSLVELLLNDGCALMALEPA